jgi:monothiol glutaredoxin
MASDTVTTSANAAIAKMIADNDVVLFMKGTKQFPQCGFSATAVKILEHLGVPFKDVNVLEDQGVREGIKTFSNWPTIPQLYVKGEFVGGCDIMREMYSAGELHDLIFEKGIPHSHHHG